MKVLMADLKHREITDLILKAFYRVYHELGYGFLEKVPEPSFKRRAFDNTRKGTLSWTEPLGIKRKTRDNPRLSAS